MFQTWGKSLCIHNTFCGGLVVHIAIIIVVVTIAFLARLLQTESKPKKKNKQAQ